MYLYNMKTEQEIRTEIQNIKNKCVPELTVAINEAVEKENWDDAMEACFSLQVNLAALEAALRIVGE